MSKAKTTKKDEYTASLRCLGRYVYASGATISEAIEGLKPGVARGATILTITHGKNSKERIIGPVQTARLFNAGGLTRAVAIKNTSLMYEGV